MVSTTRPPTKPYVIGIKASGGTDANEYATIRNGRTRDYKKIKLVNGEGVINLKELTATGAIEGTHTDWANADVIHVTISGGRRGSASHTVDTTLGSVTLTITTTDVSTTNAPAITIG